MNTYFPLEEKNIKIHGRTVERSPLALFWTGSGIELVTDATELHFELESGFDIYEQWIRIEVNGYSSVRMPLGKGVSDICVFRGMEKRSMKHVRLFKEVQPMGADCDSYLRVISVKADGALYPVGERPYLLEFIGDSITSGEGLGGRRGLNEWVPSVFTTEKHYVLETARLLDADFNIISQSGWGVYSSWDNNVTHALPKIYPYVCGPQIGGIAETLGSREPYGFGGRAPDAVIVNLGTNDANAFKEPAWVDPETGKKYELNTLDDGSFDPADLKKISDAVKGFLKTLRCIHKDAYIVWAYGMIGRPLKDCIEGAVNEYISENGDRRAEFCLLPDIEDEWIAANEHPGRGSHAAAAKTLAGILRERLT